MDLIACTVGVISKKHKNPQSSNCTTASSQFLTHRHLTMNAYFLSKNSITCTEHSKKQRQRITHKFGNPRLNQITFYFPPLENHHTMPHKTKDILHVMQLLGHRNIKNTLKHTQLISLKDNDYACKTATNVKEGN
jgi:hypothetical protein